MVTGNQQRGDRFITRWKLKKKKAEEGEQVERDTLGKRSASVHQSGGEEEEEANDKETSSSFRLADPGIIKSGDLPGFRRV